MKVLVSLLFAALSLPAVAACPAPPDRSAEMDALFARLQAAPSELEARPFNAALWEIWLDAPDAAAQALLDAGRRAHRVADSLTALRAYDRLVAYCPDYAEGYNQRAFVNFLSGRFAAAQADLLKAVEREPRHVGALSGLALTLIELGEPEAAQIWLRRALALNPWLTERHLLAEPAGREL